MRAALFVLLVLGQCRASHDDDDGGVDVYCSGGPSPDASPNLWPIDSSPTLRHEADYKTTGRLYTALHPTANASYPVLHLYGTPYEMGYAQGSLLGERCLSFWRAFWGYLLEQAGGASPATEAALNASLAAVEASSAPYVPAAMTQELRGLAAATGAEYRWVLWIHLFPETAGGHCSMFGAWGAATAGGAMGGRLLQMRALDYITADFLSHNHALTVYHPDPGTAGDGGDGDGDGGDGGGDGGDGGGGDGVPFVKVGFVGTVHAVTGLSDAPLGLCEIGVSNPDSSFGPQRSGQGIPFNFLLRQLLQHSRSVADARRAISAANRTVDLVLGLGGDPDRGADPAVGPTEPAAAAAAAAALPWPAPTFTGVRYSADRATFYGDGPSMLPVNASWHAPIESVVYQGMDWLCPGWTRKLGEQLRAHHGALTAEVAIRHVNPIVQTGDLHVAIYEVAKRVLYVSFSAGSDAPAGAPRKAYDRPYIRFDAAALFAVAPPHSQRGRPHV